jgi:hypothetical protein
LDPAPPLSIIKRLSVWATLYRSLTLPDESRHQLASIALFSERMSATTFSLLVFVTARD